MGRRLLVGFGGGGGEDGYRDGNGDGDWIGETGLEGSVLMLRLGFCGELNNNGIL